MLSDKLGLQIDSDCKPSYERFTDEKLIFKIISFLLYVVDLLLSFIRT